jgi:hypothetical protein
LLGLDAENEDCLVRCLSCRKEVVNPNKDSEADEELNDTGSGHLRKVNPGPSSARIYRSNVPFSAQPLVQEPILEESSDEALFPTQAPSNLFAMSESQPHRQLQSAGDSRATEKPPVVRVPSTKWMPQTAEMPSRKEVKAPQASPLRYASFECTRHWCRPNI